MLRLLPLVKRAQFRNVVPKATEDMLKKHQLAACENQF
jgi:hypothetical protein